MLKKKKCQTKISQDPLDLGFKSGRSKCSICYDMLDFYKKKKKKQKQKKYGMSINRNKEHANYPDRYNVRFRYI